MDRHGGTQARHRGLVTVEHRLRSFVSLIMCTGGEYRGVRRDRHFSAASSFQIGVSHGRRVAAHFTNDWLAHGLTCRVCDTLIPSAVSSVFSAFEFFCVRGVDELPDHSIEIVG